MERRRVCIKIRQGEKLGLSGPFRGDELQYNVLMEKKIGGDAGESEKAQVVGKACDFPPFPLAKADGARHRWAEKASGMCVRSMLRSSR